MTRSIVVCMLLVVSTAALEVPEGQDASAPATPTTGASRASESMFAELPRGFRPYCVWEDKGPSDPSLVDAEYLARAVQESAAWIRAVLRHEYVPEDIETRVVGVVDGIDGYDVTRVEFVTNEFSFLITQKAWGITVVARPLGQDAGPRSSSREDLEAYLRNTLDMLFNHAKASQFLSEFKETPFGLKMTRDENLYDENGVRLSYEERQRISRLAQPEQSEVLHTLRRFREARLQETDPALRDELVGGALNYWWAQVGAETDGRVIILRANKAYGGSVRGAVIKNWFRKEELRPHRKYIGGPLPPKDRTTKDSKTP